MLRLENINWKTPDGVGIIDGLDLDVSEGRLIVITGPNAAKQRLRRSSQVS